MKKRLGKMMSGGSLLARLPLTSAPLMRVATAAVLLKDGGTYRAFERACTHQGTLVEWEPANGSFYCNNHGARFSATGDVIVGPALTALRPITVSVAADGSVTYSR